MAKRFHDEVLTLGARALASGGVLVNPGRIRWDISGDCSDAYVTDHYARPSRSQDNRMIVVKKGSQAPMTVEIHTRCRRCRNCLEQRRRLWGARSAAETRLWPRTWFGTLTLRPEAHHLMLARARAKLDRQGVDFETLPEDEQFRLREAQSWRELSLYLKRVRAAYKGRLRHYTVTEKHQTGLPHYHCLIHQCSASEPLTYRVVAQKWDWGFVKFKLVNEASEVGYVSKYLSKSPAARVRASRDYGSPLGVANEMKRETLL